VAGREQALDVMAMQAGRWLVEQEQGHSKVTGDDDQMTSETSR